MKASYQLSAYILAGFIFIIAGILADGWPSRISYFALGMLILLINVLRLRQSGNGK